MAKGPDPSAPAVATGPDAADRLRRSGRPPGPAVAKGPDPSAPAVATGPDAADRLRRSGRPP
ncbi:stress protein, partial [Streptomyces nigra]